MDSALNNLQKFLCHKIQTNKLTLVGIYGISTIVGYLMPNPLYTYISNIYDLVGLGFMAYQPLLVTHTYILNIYMICKHIFVGKQV